MAMVVCNLFTLELHEASDEIETMAIYRKGTILSFFFSIFKKKERANQSLK